MTAADTSSSRRGTTVTTVTLPSVLGAGVSRGRVELTQFFRAREQVVFTFTFPAIILVLLGSIFDGRFQNGVTAGQVFSASMVAAGVVATSFNNLGIGVALDRADGTLKRLRGTPMPPAAYFAGKVILVAVAGLAEVVLLLAVGMLMFGVSLPGDAENWFTFGWVFVLSVVSCSLLGIAIASVARSAQSAAAVVNVPYIALQFMSGVYIPIDSVPPWMRDIGSVFPVKWAAQGFRSVFLPDSMMVREAAGTWELGRTATVLGAWCVIGLALCLLTFRWTSRRTG